MVFSISIFFFITLGIGSVTAIAGWSEKEDLLERAVVSSGVGLLSIPIIGILFNLLHVPIDYKLFIIFAAAALIFSAVYFFKHNRFRLVFFHDNFAILSIFAVSLYMYLKGSFAYPWLESQDPWSFASATKYIAIFKKFTAPFIFSDVSQPYPQGYQIIMAILHQTNQSINWTMKFFNGLFVSMSLLFFYYFAKKIISDKVSALLALAFLASMPAWLTHYIFALNLNMVFLPLFFYTIEKSRENPRWNYLAGLAFSSIWAAHYYTAFIITVMAALYSLTKSFCVGRLDRPRLKIYLFGFLTTLLLFIAPSYLTAGRSPINNQIALGGIDVLFARLKGAASHSRLVWMSALFVIAAAAIYKIFKSRPAFITRLTAKPFFKPALFFAALISLVSLLFLPKKILYIMGSGSIDYDINNFFLFSNNGNLIQNPFGLGIVPMTVCVIGAGYSLFIISKLFTEKYSGLAVLFVWTIFSFLGVMGSRFSVSMMPFRIWPFFAFSAALLGAFAFNELTAKLKNKVKIGTAAFLILLTIPCWYLYKFSLNTGAWTEGYLGTIDSKKLYAWIKNNIPKNSRVYSFSVNQFVPIAFDMISMPWDEEVYKYTEKDLEGSIEKDHDFLKKKGYEYAVIDGSGALCKYMYGNKDLEEKLRFIVFIKNVKLLTAKREKMKAATDYFKLIKECPSGAIFEVN